MKELSRVAAAVRASTTLAVDSLYKKMLAEGHNVISFGAGEPDFNTPEHIKQAGIQAIEENFTKYTPSAGIEPLRRAVCERLAADCGVTYEPKQIVVSSGAKHCLFAALMCVLNPGDEVILPAPFWVSYYELILMAGGVPVILPTGEADGFKITPQRLEEAVTPKTKLLILNNPSNPTGMVYSEEELRALGEVCVRKDLYIISDEIYYRLVYDGFRFVSMASLGEEIRERTILINGVSKTYAMTGWRIGYAAANETIAKMMSNYLSHSTGSPCSVAQKAALTAFAASQDTVDEMQRSFEERRNYIVDRMNRIEGISCLKPEGAFYVVMNIEKLIGKTIAGTVIRDADDFSQAFLEQGLVAVVSCVGFGAPNLVRWSYATSMEQIREGLDRLEKFLKS